MKTELMDSLEVLKEKIGIISKQIMEIGLELEIIEEVLNE